MAAQLSKLLKSTKLLITGEWVNFIGCKLWINRVVSNKREEGLEAWRPGYSYQFSRRWKTLESEQGGAAGPPLHQCTPAYFFLLWPYSKLFPLLGTPSPLHLAKPFSARCSLLRETSPTTPSPAWVCFPGHRGSWHPVLPAVLTRTDTGEFFVSFLAYGLSSLRL